MQTSGNSSWKTTRVAGMASAIGFAIVVTGNWLACSPGEPDCTKVSCNDSGGTGGDNNTGGSGGGGTMMDPPPAACDGLMVATVDDFETKFIVPKCGQSMCHGPRTVFPPKNLDMPDMIRPTLVGKNGSLACKTDFYIDKKDYTKSFVLAKITATGDYLPCPGAPTGKADAGGTRMPNKTGMPGAQGDPLSAGEIECFTWYVKSVAH